jgi:hypothetical protein
MAGTWSTWIWGSVMLLLLVLFVIIAIAATLAQKTHKERKGRGPRGTTGPRGFQGFLGATGADGADGATGADGFEGPTGADGADGATGADGFEGPTGADGAEGFSLAIVPTGNGVLIVDVFGMTGFVSNGATGPGVARQLSWAAGPLDINVGDIMTFGGALAPTQQLGSILMTATGVTQCMYIQLSEAAASGGAAAPSAGFDFQPYLDGVPMPSLSVTIQGANTGGFACAPIPFSSGQSWSVAVSAVTSSGQDPQSEAFASASISYI